MNVILLHSKHGGCYCVIKLHSYTQVHLLVFFLKQYSTYRTNEGQTALFKDPVRTAQ